MKVDKQGFPKMYPNVYLKENNLWILEGKVSQKTYAFISARQDDHPANMGVYEFYNIKCFMINVEAQPTHFLHVLGTLDTGIWAGAHFRSPLNINLPRLYLGQKIPILVGF